MSFPALRSFYLCIKARPSFISSRIGIFAGAIRFQKPAKQRHPCYNNGIGAHDDRGFMFNNRLAFEPPSQINSSFAGTHFPLQTGAFVDASHQDFFPSWLCGDCGSERHGVGDTDQSFSAGRQGRPRA